MAKSETTSASVERIDERAARGSGPRPRVKPPDIAGRVSELLSGADEAVASDLLGPDHPRLTSALDWMFTALKRAVRTTRRAKRRARAGVLDALLRSSVYEPRRLSPEESYRVNGFALYRGLIPKDEALALAERLRAAVGEARIGASLPDALSKLPEADALLYDERVHAAVQSVLQVPLRFLQVCDVQTDHNREGWHRDTACRRFGSGDWQEQREPYRIAKIILYLDIERAGLAVLPGSHKARALPFWRSDDLRDFVLVRAETAAVPALCSGHPSVPAVLEMSVGDALVFDQRLLHCGRRLNDERSRFAGAFAHPKTTLAYVFGADNRHSWRFWSFFRFHRKQLRFKELREAQRARLEQADLLPSFYGRNVFEEHPEELSALAGKWAARPRT